MAVRERVWTVEIIPASRVGYWCAITHAKTFEQPGVTWHLFRGMARRKARRYLAQMPDGEKSTIHFTGIQGRRRGGGLSRAEVIKRRRRPTLRSVPRSSGSSH